MSDLLLLLCKLQTSNVLFKLTFSDAVLILNVFQGDLGVFPQLSQLVLVLEHKMLQTLFVNFDFNLVFFLKILELTFFVSEFGLFVFQLFLSDKPEIVYTKALIIVKPNKVLFFFDEFSASDILKKDPQGWPIIGPISRESRPTHITKV